MSLQAMVWAIQDVADLEPSGKLLLIVIGNYAGDDWSCWPSQATLARDTGMGKRSVTRWLAKLEEGGMISREPRFKPGQGNRSAGQLSDIIYLKRKDPTPDCQGVSRGGAGHSHVVGAPVATVANEPSTEPPKEPRAADAALSAASADPSPARQAFDAFNRAVEDMNIRLPMNPPRSVALKLTDGRRKALNARLKECGGLDGWLEMLLRAERSEFLTGSTRHRFSISLDFMLQPSSFTKLAEGFYDGERRNGSAAPPGGGSAIRTQRNTAMFAGAHAAVDRHERERGRSGGS